MASEMSCIDFAFEGHGIRLLRNGGIWAVLADVCEALDIAQPTRVAERLDADEKGVTTIHTPGGRQEMLIVSEPGLYKLIATSRKPIAVRFDRMVRHEVLPSIREHGCYPPPTKIAPPAAMIAITQLFDQFDRDKLEPMRADIKEIKTDLKVVVDNTSKGRKKPNAETERNHHKTICHQFFYLCPCEIRCGIQIADENGFIPNVWDYHHQYGSWDNRAEATIPLAKECHQRITNDIASRRRFDQTAFPEFQNAFSRMQPKQLKLNLPLPKE